MSVQCKAIAATAADQPLAPFELTRRACKPHDVKFDVKFCGVCHSDLHQARNEWHNSTYPMVPGHEIVGYVSEVGSAVTKFKVGDRVGVGCLVDSCRKCKSCQKGLEQYCAEGPTFSYNGVERDGSAPTQGGYSNLLVCDEEYVVRVPDNLDLAAAAPLLCAGITTYSPLRHWGCKEGTRVGVVGLGGLGHMAVKLAKAMGAHVTVFTTSESKVETAKAMGADRVIISKNAEAMAAAAGSLDLTIDTVGSSHDLAPYIGCLDIDGQHVLVGAPETPNPPIHSFSLIMGRKTVAGSCIGGIAETQEMLDFCGKHNITCEIELIQGSYINEAYTRMLKSDVKYRFVIDCGAL